MEKTAFISRPGLNRYIKIEPFFHFQTSTSVTSVYIIVNSAKCATTQTAALPAHVLVDLNMTSRRRDVLVSGDTSTVASHGTHAITNRPHFDCLFNSFFQDYTTVLLALWDANSLVIGDSLHKESVIQKASHAVTSSSWLHRDSRLLFLQEAGSKPFLLEMNSLK